MALPPGPHGPTRLIGRSDELARLHELFDGGARLVTLVGAPGVGKTRLLRHFARELAESGADVAIVPLGPATAGAVLAETIAALRLGARVTARGATFARVAERLDAKETWLLLDEAEHVRDEVRDFVSMALDETSRARILVTSRERLDVPPEHVVRVEPLPPESAVELLRDALGRAASRWPLGEVDARALVARVDGLPLAIELLASRVASLGAREVLDDASRPVSLSALDTELDESVALLGEEARLALGALSIFGDGFTLDAAEAVLRPEAEAARAVRELVDASLVRARRSSVERFEMLTVVRTFASARLGHSDRRDAIARRYVAFFAREHGDVSKERTNLLVAFDNAKAFGDAAAVGRLALALDPILVRHGPPELHGDVLRSAIGACAAESNETILLAELHRVHARYLALRGRQRDAVAEAERALSLSVGDDRVRAWTRSVQCFARRAIGDLDGAESAAREALAYARDARDLKLEALTEQALGLVEHARRNHDDALQAFVRALAAARRNDDDRSAGIALANRALTLFARGEWAAARESYDAACACFEASEDRYHLARILPIDVALERKAGALATAERKFVSGVEAARDQADLVGEAELLLEGARIAMLRGERARADVRLAEAKIIARGVEDVALAAEIADVERTLRGAERGALVLEIAAEARTVVLEGGAAGRAKIDLARRAALRRILLALVERHARGSGGLSIAEARAAGWPGEKMRAESASARVYMAIRRLRALGLDEAIVTTDEGYALASIVRIANC